MEEAHRSQYYQNEHLNVFTIQPCFIICILVGNFGQGTLQPIKRGKHPIAVNFNND